MSSKSSKVKRKRSKVSQISEAEQRDFAAWHANRFDGRSQAELAPEHDCKVATFRSRVHRHQERLRLDDLALEALDLLMQGQHDGEIIRAIGIGAKALIGLRRVADDYEHYTADA